jgi:hypothetical protein
MSTVRIQVRRGTAADWTAANPTLAAGEVGFDTTSNKMKVGDGSTAWSSLAYISSDAPGVSEIAQDAIAQALSVGSGLSKTYDDAGNTISLAVDTAVVQTRVANVSDTEIGYLDGVTSAIQTQLNAKAASADITELAQDAVNTALVAGSGISKAYNDAANTITVTNSGVLSFNTRTGAVTLSANDVNTALGYTAADAADLATLTGNTADDITGAISTAATYTDTAITTAINAVTTTDIEEGTNKYFTDNRAKDAVGNATTGGYGLGKTYDANTRQLEIFSKVRAINNLKSTVANTGHVDFEIESDPTITGAVTSDSLVTGDITATEIMANSLTLTGNLYVSGTTTAISTTNLELTDPMIYLGKDNNANLVDIGFVGSFTGTSYGHTGLVRDASTNTWVLFKDVTDEPTTTINFAQGSRDDLKLANLVAEGATIGDVSNTELQRLNGVTSNVQDQINARGYATDGIFNNSTMHTLNVASFGSALPGDIINAEQIVNGQVTYNKLDSGVKSTLDAVTTKSPSESPTFTGTVNLPATTSIGNVSSVELAYVDGVTSSIQGQLDNKASVTDMNAKASSSSLTSHTSATTSVHGIADTSALALTATVNSGLALKANLDSPTFTGTVSGITNAMVGLGNVNNTSDTAKPISTATQTALDLKAPLASPALTGVPTAPTASDGTATTQVATTEFVGTAVSNLVASAPAALNTLNELATALGNDAAFSTTITNSIATKSPIASPTFTGTVTAPAITATALITASASGVAFTDGTQTKEGVASRTPIIQKTADYTLSALTERDSLIEVNSASAVIVTIPANSTVAYPIGTSIDILQTGAGQISVAGAAGVTVNATPGLKLRTQWSGATLFKRATNTWVLYGDLSA